MQKRISDRISANEALNVGKNPFIFPGYIENKPGVYTQHKAYSDISICQLYRVTPYDF